MAVDDAPEPDLCLSVSAAAAAAPEAIAGPGGQLHPVGEIAGVVAREVRTHCGTLLVPPALRAPPPPPLPGAPPPAALPPRHALFLRPVNAKIPLIRVSTAFPWLYAGKRVCVMVDGWRADEPCPFGHVVRLLGDVGDTAAEHEVILSEFDVPHDDFTPEQLACVPAGDGLDALRERDARAQGSRAETTGKQKKKKLAGQLSSGSARAEDDDSSADSESSDAMAAFLAAGAAREPAVPPEVLDEAASGIEDGGGGEARWDLTDRPIASIDPPGCRDIDDTIHACIITRGAPGPRTPRR
jgi:exoribonuclease R